MNELQLLILSAAFLGFIHTLLGPDHYLPFIVLSKARNWSISKTLWITFVSGIGHVGGSVILGIIGIAMGIGLHRLEYIESARGNLVGWLLIIFGLLYTLYGIKKYLKNGGHFHLPHFMMPKKVREMHNFSSHNKELQNEDVTKLTPWILFLIFVFGPCEVLIPLLIFPAAEFNAFGIAAVSIVFGIATITTMMFSVYIGNKGASLIKVKNGEKFFHLIAGLVILISGAGMQFMGW
jgi:sulfite exporter TauE/SafE